MMTWFLVYLFNLRIPLLVVSALGILLCGVIGFWSYRLRMKTHETSLAHDAAVWRQMICLKIGIGLSVLSAMVWAIPAPDYDIRYVDRPVRVEVVKWKPVYKGEKILYNSYKELYDDCLSRMSGSIYEAKAKQCHDQAMVASRPPPRLIKQIVKIRDSYKTLFDDCNGFSLEDTPDNIVGQVRNQRLTICHKAALEGSKAH